MNNYYTSEKNVNMLVYLLKANNIRKVIASPGTTNITFVASLQYDPFFELYSAADERSAAYMACGLSAESGEPVVLSCTGATASRNYIPGLTEAYYRKLPILAVTSTQHTGKIGQLCPQVIDRTVIQNDISVMHIDVPTIHDSDDEWSCNLKLNTAILALKHHGGGPVHINLTTTYSRDFSIKELPEYRVIRRITTDDNFPMINASKVGIFVGSHNIWSEELTHLVEEFCEKYNGVVLCDHTSNYSGKYKIPYSILSAQLNKHYATERLELIIDLGEVSGAYMRLFPQNVWRVNQDGVIRDTFHKLTYMFDMSEACFFKRMNSLVDNKVDTSLYSYCKNNYDEAINNIPELPFSNAWIAQQTTNALPDNSVLHLGILNSLRNWNFFEIPSSVHCYSNTGGFGIDGLLSSLIGASLSDNNKLFFIVLGDLAFFYDLNSIANRHVGSNIRILLVNNGVGTEFKNYSHFAAQFSDNANSYIAAAGHYGCKSKTLVKHYAEDLGFIYLSASNKEEYLNSLDEFVSVNNDKSTIFEVFTDSNCESDALKMINNIILGSPNAKDIIKSTVKKVCGESSVEKIKRIIKR